MLKTWVVLALIAVMVLAAPAIAGDIVDMPTGNMVAPNHAEINYIFWDLDTPPGPAPDYIHIFEGFVGVTDWAELDVIVADVENDDTYVKFNGYVRVLPEGPNKPSLIVGATNLFASDWPGNDEFSPFVLSSYNLMTPAGPPKLSDPLVRLHLAYGWEANGDQFFGGVQFLVTPKLGGAVFNYQDQPAYVAVYRPTKTWELRAGFKEGDPFYSAGAFLDW
ncbi:MAG: hypothetical protein KKI08_27220 [Armatimonadetes bacterium]|nr:hypothetical protein [Armatimonadota bacterium]